MLVRDKDAPRAERCRIATSLLRGLEGSGATVSISDDLGLAADLGLGVHLSEEGPSIAAARAALGDRRIGASRHDAGGLGRSLLADYATLSPVLGSPGKGPALGWPAFTDALPEGLPVLALGGVGPDQVATARQAGAAGVAAIRAAWSVPAPVWAEALSAWAP